MATSITSLNEDLVSDEGRSRRIEARRAMAGERVRIRCKRCKREIPEERDKKAKFCTDSCRNSYYWDGHNELKREIRVYERAERTVSECECGAGIEKRAYGPPAKRCKRCVRRDQQRRRRDRKKTQDQVSTGVAH